MFEPVDELDAHGAADALVAAHRAVRAAEAHLFVLAAHWANLHDGEPITAGPAPLPGQQRVVPIRGRRRGNVEGCPQIAEYAGAELAALTGRSTAAGEQLIADAVAVRHRHPLLWSAIRAGTAPTWVAAQVARRCIRAGLDATAAEWLDAQTSPYVATLPPKRFLELVEAKIIEADPAAAEERARTRALARFVQAGGVDEDGLRTLVARAHAGDITYLVAVLDRIAHLLAERGDHQPIPVLRTQALRILANPARALALLTEATLDAEDPFTETPGDLGHHALFPHGTTAGLLDAHGHPLPASIHDLTALPLLDEHQVAALPDAHPLLAPHLTLATSPATSPDTGTSTGESQDRALLTALLTALQQFDATRLDPVTVLHVHLTESAVAARQGVVRVEELGPMVLAQLRDWLTHPLTPDQIQSQIRLRPVLDADAVLPVDRHEVPAPMSELTTCRTPYEAFPFGTLRARRADDDHARPYLKDGPPGQTSLEALAKLSRFHHRLKTNGNWVLHHPDLATYWWRTPHGHWFLVDPTGTHWHGPDPHLDHLHHHDPTAA